MKFCFTGGKVGDIEALLDTSVRYVGRRGTVSVHVGVNDINDRKSVKFQNKYKNLVNQLKTLRCRVMVTGMLTKRSFSMEWGSRAHWCNKEVKQMCSEAGSLFADIWDNLYGTGKGYLYARDGVHFSKKG